MDIGTYERTVKVEPLTAPLPRKEPDPPQRKTEPAAPPRPRAPAQSRM